MGDRCEQLSDEGHRCARPAGHTGYHRSDSDPQVRWGRPDLTTDERDLLHGLAWDAMGQAGGLDRDDLARLGELAERAWHELALLHEEVDQLRLVRELASVVSWGVDALWSTVRDPSVWPQRLDELWAFLHLVVDHGEPADPDRIARLQRLVDQAYDHQRPDAIPGSEPPAQPVDEGAATVDVALEAEGTHISLRAPRGTSTEIVRTVPSWLVADYRDARTRLDRAREAVLAAAGYDPDDAWQRLMDEQAALLDRDDDRPADP